jgi:hypothetical protein
MLPLTHDFTLFPSDGDLLETRMLDHCISQSERQTFRSNADNVVKSEIMPTIEHLSSRDVGEHREDNASMKRHPRPGDEQRKVPLFKGREDQEDWSPMPAAPRPKNLPTPDLDPWDGVPICPLCPAQLPQNGSLMVKEHALNGSYPQHGTCCRLNQSRLVGIQADAAWSPDWNEYFLSLGKIPALRLND